MSTPPRHKPAKHLLLLGAVGTVLWLACFVIYANWKWTKVLELEPNELGDFLAGAFAPPVFGWLILGYFMQARELRLQVEELREQVEATRRLAQSANKRIDLDVSENQPLFEYSSVVTAGEHAIILQDAKQTKFFNVELVECSGELVLDRVVNMGERNQHRYIKVAVQKPGNGTFRIAYTDVMDFRYSIGFDIAWDGKALTVKPRDNRKIIGRGQSGVGKKG